MSASRRMDPKRRRRIGLWSVAVVLGLSFLLPLGSYGLHWLGQEAVAQDITGGIVGGSNPRSNFWGAVGKGVEGYSAVKGEGANVLVERSGTDWLATRNGSVSKILPWAVVVMAVLIVLFHLIFGRQKLDRPLSGRRVPRWSWFNRLLHWTTAVSFIALAVTGMSMLIGRNLLIPLLGKAGFAIWAQASIQIHNVIGPVFSVCIVLMIVLWIWHNFPNKVDMQWLKAGGGLFSKNAHPSAGRFNAGEKLWFWALATGGLVVVLSGIILVAPSYNFELAFLDNVRQRMGQANLIHAILAVLWTALALGHIYIGTAGTEGAFEGMSTGYVSEEWARQHHDLWHAKMVEKGKVVDQVAQAGHASSAAPQTVHTR